MSFLIHEENVGFTEYNVVCKADRANTFKIRKQADNSVLIGNIFTLNHVVSLLVSNESHLVFLSKK